MLQQSGCRGHGGRATILFGALSGEEQGLLGTYHLPRLGERAGLYVGANAGQRIVGGSGPAAAPTIRGFWKRRNRRLRLARARWRERLKRLEWDASAIR